MLLVFHIQPPSPPPHTGNESSNYFSGICSGIDFLLDKTNLAVAPWCFIYLSTFWREGNFSFKPGIRYEDSELIPFVTSKVTRLAKLTEFSCYKYIQHSDSFMRSKVTRNHILSNLVIVNNHTQYAALTDVRELRLWFEKSASSAFISGIKQISQLDGDKIDIFKEFVDNIEVRPRTLYGDNFRQKIFQWLILNFPKLYLKIFCQINGK